MPIPDHGAEPLVPGLYDQLVTAALARQLDGMPEGYVASIEEIGDEEAHSVVSQFLEHLVAQSLSNARGKERRDLRRRLVARLFEVLRTELHSTSADEARIEDPLRRLLAVHPAELEAKRPDTALARSALLTGTRMDPSLASQLSKEIAAAGHVDILCSFIRWSGIRLLLDALRELTSRPDTDRPRLRVITTSYMGATDARAIEAIADLPRTEVRVSYDTQRTRLHAKAYLIQRESGFGSAYIGSANISKAALSDGLEWTSKISQYELPHLWRKVIATFETYWNDNDFEAFDPSRPERLRDAILTERRSNSSSTSAQTNFDLRPYTFQEEILDAIAAERQVLGKSHHLVVAATGTGKTMIAAFDYRAWSSGRRPSLLFVAHREEILTQALGAFRGVLRDQNFGHVLAGGRSPGDVDHLFCSIQSYNSRDLSRLEPDRFEYVVIDEFHHAAAPSYQRLLDHVRPKVLLGLTATPERSDGLDVLRWFDGEASAEVRLPDAINRGLLCPFQYFGIADSVDLSGLTWQRGGYKASDLDRVYTGNDARAGLVVDKYRELSLDPLGTRSLGFCVSVAHAEFMAQFFNAHGVPALALSSESSVDDRKSAIARLVRRDVNVLFVVDLYNEGVDIPEIDTVLFLRPTESLTVYLQQLGRGLRRHDEKDCLTVLDFIGSQRREFRFAARLRALSNDPTRRVEKEVVDGFPGLPPGCSIRLERVAQERILENVRQSLRLPRPRMIADIRELAGHLNRTPTLQESIEYLDVSLDDLLKKGLWSRLLSEAGADLEVECPDEEVLQKGIRRVALIDDPRQVEFLRRALRSKFRLASLDQEERTRIEMLQATLWGRLGSSMTIEQAVDRLRGNPTAGNDLLAVLEYRRRHMQMKPSAMYHELSGPLALHASYSRDEILFGLGHWSFDHRPEFREGVLHLAERRVDAFFVTLHKTEDAYSPTTMYEDYAIGDDLFHWQSQSTTSEESPTGQRYIRHKEHGYTPLLFVREHRKHPSGLTSPYAYLGPARYVSHHGSRPLSIVWRLEAPIPARLRTRVAPARTG